MVRIADMVPGHKMCCLCFEFIPIDDLYVDREGQKWDTCKPCNAYEEVCIALRKAGWEREQILEILRQLTLRASTSMLGS